MHQGRILYGEIFESTFCAANPNWCTMRNLQPGAEFEVEQKQYYHFGHKESEQQLVQNLRHGSVRLNRWVHSVKWIKEDDQLDSALRELRFTKSDPHS